MADYFAATNPPLITWSNAAGTDAIAAQDWMYDPRMAQFAEMYNTAANSATYRPEALALGITSPLIGDHYRNLVGTTTEPFLMEPKGLSPITGCKVILSRLHPAAGTRSPSVRLTEFITSSRGPRE
jgi:hypothetical protein